MLIFEIIYFEIMKRSWESFGRYETPEAGSSQARKLVIMIVG